MKDYDYNEILFQYKKPAKGDNHVWAAVDKKEKQIGVVTELKKHYVFTAEGNAQLTAEQLTIVAKFLHSLNAQKRAKKQQELNKDDFRVFRSY